MKIKILIGVLISLLVILVVSSAIPAGDKGQSKGGGNAKAPEIETFTFVNIPYWTSPPWYPPAEETDTYRWAPKYYWANPSIVVEVNATQSGFADLDAVVAEVGKGFGAWSGVGTDYSATVERDDTVGPGFDWGNTVEVTWGTIDGSGGIIAITYFWYYVNTKQLIDCDIIFDAAEPWSISVSVPSAKFDVWNVAAHEAGHTLVLDDLRSPRDGALTMHAYTWPGDNLKRTLGTGDNLGIQEIYGE